MIVILDKVSKRYHKEWIIKELSHVFKAHSITGIIGSNGSGKSTLLKLISAAEIASSGSFSYTLNQQDIAADNLYQYLSFSAPYMDLAEELTAEELFDFHLNFKLLQEGLNKESFFKLIQLQAARNKMIKNFSSGMKQRLKLGLAIAFQSELLLLDEPCSNLDQAGVEMYQQLLKQYAANRTILIGSNEDENELFLVKDRLKLWDYK